MYSYSTPAKFAASFALIAVHQAYGVRLSRETGQSAVFDLPILAQLSNSIDFTPIEDQFNFSQTQNTQPDCPFYHNRVKNKGNIFFGTQGGQHEFQDLDFTGDAMISDSWGSKQGNVNHLKPIHFTPSLDILKAEEQGYSLFGNGAKAEDIYQGQLGDCWFMHGASTVAMRPGRLESIFLNNELSSNGVYGVNLHILGIKTTVVVDDQIPIGSNGSLLMAQIGEVNKALWPAILEKAMAKLHGTYENIISGDAAHSIEVLTGAPATGYQHDNTLNACDPEQFSCPTLYSADEVFEQIKANTHVDGSNIYNMISAGTDGSDNTQETAEGLAQGHVYTVLGGYEIGGKKLIRVRNPWGHEQYRGPWKDHDTTNWDQTIHGAQKTYKQHMQEQGLYNENTGDGIFFIDLQTYFDNFVQTQIHLDTTHMEQDHILVVEDSSTNIVDGRYLHTFYLKSEGDQDVHVSVHTWPTRTYPVGCNVESASHRIKIEEFPYDWNNHGAGTRWSFKGSLQHPVFSMTTGSTKKVTLEMDWDNMVNGDGTRDFSIVVWREEGKPVVIYSDEDLHYSDFPVVAKQEFDNNAVQESGADLCVDNPQWDAFHDWYTGQAALAMPSGSGQCTYSQGWSSSGSDASGWDIMYSIRGACNGAWNSWQFEITQTTEFWSNSFISENAVLMSTVTSGNNMTKKFNVWSEMDRVAIFSPRANGITGEQLTNSMSSSLCSNSCQDPRASWTIIPSSGNDPSQCAGGAPTYTSGIEAAATCSFNDNLRLDTDRVQEDITAYLTGPLAVHPNMGSDPQNACKFQRQTGTGTNDYSLVGTIVNCPKYENHVIRVSITDTKENWQNTVEHCSNTLVSCVVLTNGDITKTYATNADQGNSVMFGRGGNAKTTDPSFSYGVYWNNNVDKVSTWGDVTPTTEEIKYCGDNVGTAFDFTDLCISDEETPQNCLNSWINGYDVYSKHAVNYNFCGTSNIWNRHFSSTHDYLLKYGGCEVNNKSVDVYFEQLPSVWETVMTATGSKIHQYATYGGNRTCPTGKECKKFNVQRNGGQLSNQQDRVGYRIPKGGWSGSWTASYQATWPSAP